MNKTRKPMSEKQLRRSGPWSPEQIDDFLQGSLVPIRLGVLDRGGTPIIVSLWFIWENGCFWCATQRSAKVVDYLVRDGRCGLEISTNEPPYQGIRGAARAEIVSHDGERVLRLLLRRYMGREDTSLGRWLLGRVDDEVAIRIEPDWISSWDFTRRMGESGAAASRAGASNESNAI